MESIVGVTRGEDKFSAFKELLELTAFNDCLTKAFAASKKEKKNFSIVIKPNMMVFINPKGHTAVVTDKELVEYLVDHIIKLGFSDIRVCDAQTDVGKMLKNQNVKFVAEQIGYRPGGRYSIVDLTLESRPYRYEYLTRKGAHKGEKRWWNDTVGVSWRDADFRISFAKCKTHEHDWMTLSVKNIYGCFPRANKVARYHMKYEVWNVTACSMRNFPVHFAFVDAWVGSDGFQGYKIPHPQNLKMLFGGSDPIAVDLEIFRRAGLDGKISRILARSVFQLYAGRYPRWEVKGDTQTLFADILPWENINPLMVNKINKWEEHYIDWGWLNLKAAATEVDYALFPPKNIFFRFVEGFSKFFYILAMCIPIYRNLYKLKN